MISREEAKEDFELQEVSRGYVNSNFLDWIYDSIGSCGECKNWKPNSTIKGTCDLSDKEWFCADFERKDNVEA